MSFGGRFESLVTDAAGGINVLPPHREKIDDTAIFSLKQYAAILNLREGY